jgi:hypothetical protein
VWRLRAGPWFFGNDKFVQVPNTGRIIVKESEKRRSHRHQGAAPIELEEGKGVTRDFSGTGIFFETDQSFTSGQAIEFTIVLEHVDPDRPVRLKCRGQIVRVEKSDQKIGIAAAIRSYSFQKPRDPEKGRIKGGKPKAGAPAKKKG